MKTAALFITMAALATSLGVSDTGEIWGHTAPPPEPVVSVEVTDPAPTPAPTPAPGPEAEPAGNCVTIGLLRNPVTSVGEDGVEFSTEGIYAEPFTSWKYTGNWEGHTVQASVIDTFLNYTFDQSGVNTLDMDLSSVDVSELERVTICRRPPADQ